MAESGLKIHARIQKIDPEKSLETVNHETQITHIFTSTHFSIFV